MRKLKLKRAFILAAAGLCLSSGVPAEAAIGTEQSKKVVTAEVKTAIFNDLKLNHWAYSVIQSAVKKGYLSGYTDGTFRPSANVTRAEMAAILARLSDTSERSTVTFSDVKSTHWAYSSISEGIALGFIKPTDFKDGKFNPNQIMTRQEITNWVAN